MGSKLKRLWQDDSLFWRWVVVVLMVLVMVYVLSAAVHNTWGYWGSFMLALCLLGMGLVKRLRPIWHIYPVYSRLFAATVPLALGSFVLFKTTSNTLFLLVTCFLTLCLLGMAIGIRVRIASTRKP